MLRDELQRGARFIRPALSGSSRTGWKSTRAPGKLKTHHRPADDRLNHGDYRLSRLIVPARPYSILWACAHTRLVAQSAGLIRPLQRHRVGVEEAVARFIGWRTMQRRCWN